MQVSIGSIFYLASFGPEQDSEGEVGHCLSLQLEEGLGCVGVLGSWGGDRAYFVGEIRKGDNI